MRTFNYSEIKKQKWDSDVLSLIAAIYKEAGKQEMYLKQRPEELEKLVEIAKIQSTEASNAIEGIVTTSTRIKQIVEEKTTPKNCDEQEIAGYRDVLNIIHESFDAIPITQNYILQLHKILYSHMNNPMAGRTKSVQNYISATCLIKAFIFLDCCGLIFIVITQTSFLAFYEKKVQLGIPCYLFLIECIKHKKVLSRTNRKEPNTVRNKIEQQKSTTENRCTKGYNYPFVYPVSYGTW